jgi:anti-sigma28 factor (negative regulator of flagellin synthesis)
MILRMFPITRVFNRRLRRGCRVALSQPATRSWAEMTERSSRTGRGPEPLDQLLAPSAATRADKIAQLRRAVQSDAYCVSAEQIAEKMVREVVVETLIEGLRRRPA